MKCVSSLGFVSFMVFASVGVRAQTLQTTNPTFTPFELVQNTYKYKGQSGTLDTRIIYWGSNEYLAGQKLGPWPGGGLRLAKMIDEHTAIYDVLMMQRGSGPGPEGQIAVHLEDSNPPDPLRVWRVLVEGVLEGTNGMGATIRVPAVRFDGYAEEPARKLDAPRESAQTPATRIASNRISFVEPQYPPVAKLAHMSGTVVLRATISKTGLVEKLAVESSTNPLFSKPAMDAVKQWKYRPYLVNNEPIEVETLISVGFGSEPSY